MVINSRYYTNHYNKKLLNNVVINACYYNEKLLGIMAINILLDTEIINTTHYNN